MQRHSGLVTPVVVQGAAIPREKKVTAKPKSVTDKDWLFKRIPLLVICFWSLVLTLVVIAHVIRAPEMEALTVHGYQRFVLSPKLSVALPLAGRTYASLLSYRICCNMVGGHMECPSAHDLECHVMRDEGPRLTCYWMAPRLAGVECVIYWVVAAK
jgi:hypothetical protein